MTEEDVRPVVAEYDVVGEANDDVLLADPVVRRELEAVSSDPAVVDARAVAEAVAEAAAPPAVPEYEEVGTASDVKLLADPEVRRHLGV